MGMMLRGTIPPRYDYNHPPAMIGRVGGKRLGPKRPSGAVEAITFETSVVFNSAKEFVTNELAGSRYRR